MKTTLLSLTLIAATAAPAWAAEDAYKAFATEKVAGWMASPVIQDALAVGNDAHAALSEAEIIDLDTLWRAQIELTDSPLINQVMSGPASDYLRQLVADSQGAIAEIILMDNRGLNAAISTVTSDFWQGDEDKFQQTYDLGGGGGSIHAGDVELDESSGMYVVQVSVPMVDAAGELVGAATFSLDAERL